MIKISELYQTLQEEKKYDKMNEKLIFDQLYQVTEGSLESAISYIINQAVLAHIHLNIDSTIMQMLVLNDYLIKLFMKNFDALMNNYIVHYLENHGIKEVKEQDIETIKEMISQLELKTELQELITTIKAKWQL